jgi:predicted 3-demethylubiquinone-9 3-methyltransferase (glyoxalase superfamily)
MLKIKTFLMFEGQAEEAMELYASAFPNSEIRHITRFGANMPGEEGTIQKAEFSLNGYEFVCIDSPVKHGFGFTAAMSLFIEFDNTEQIDEVFEKLSAGGHVLMSMGEYPFSKKFVWFADKFGVTWQLTLT